METAAKKKSSLALGVIALAIAFVASCLLGSAATASSVVDIDSKTRAEVSGPFTANLIENRNESPVNSPSNYDALEGVALECTVAPSSAAEKIANRSMTKAEWQSFYRQLRTHAREAAADIRATVPSGQRGPVVSAVMDARTGQFFSSKNFLDVPENLHPILNSRLQQLYGTTDIAALRGAANAGGPRWPFSTPGAHAEVHALNRALWAREAAGLPVDLGEFWMVNRWLSNSAGAAPRCGFCRPLTQGVNVLTY